jgi:hypothetical protein
VIERIRHGTDQYAPIILPIRYAIVQPSGAIVAQSQFENSSQADDRTNKQEAVFNLVWWKRVWYFSSIAVFLALLLFPIFPGLRRPAKRVHSACSAPLLDGQERSCPPLRPHG